MAKRDTQDAASHRMMPSTSDTALPLPASLAADVVEAFNIANSIIWPLPSVLMRRMHNDTRTQLQAIWAVGDGRWAAAGGARRSMNPGRDDALPSFLADDTNDVGAVHLRDELLVTQMRTLLSQDVEKVRGD